MSIHRLAACTLAAALGLWLLTGCGAAQAQSAGTAQSADTAQSTDTAQSAGKVPESQSFPIWDPQGSMASGVNDPKEQTTPLEGFWKCNDIQNPESALNGMTIYIFRLGNDYTGLISTLPDGLDLLGFPPVGTQYLSARLDKQQPDQEKTPGMILYDSSALMYDPSAGKAVMTDGVIVLKGDVMILYRGENTVEAPFQRTEDPAKKAA